MKQTLSITVFALTLAVTSTALSQNLSVSPPAADNSSAAELQSFSVSDGYEIHLFADERDGVANPICMRWDSHGRLWVLCTWAYPQLKPTAQPDDRLLILEDRDGDGRADRTTVFADGLNMPTGFALGGGGVYIAQGHDLLHVKDTDGDGKADSQRVLLTGFGTGDTHQNINSLTWSPGGELLFCQGLHAFSRVETPWGIVRLDEHGSWRLRPKRLQLHAFRRTAYGGNPWGVTFANWGEPFIKSNNAEVGEFLPNMVSTDRFFDYWGGEMTIGKAGVKSMTIEMAESPHLGKDIHGQMLIADYYGRTVQRCTWEPDGAGHRVVALPPLVTSTHNAFRPVDIHTGPDGAIYVADWFNPIIGHYQASFRHPHRDKTHGRIWRITAKDRPLAKAPELAAMNADQLCQQLESDWRYVRYQAKRLLAGLPVDKAIAAARRWVAGLDENDPGYEHRLYEAIGVFESHEVVEDKLLTRLLAANDYRARAYATRVVGRWHDRLDKPLSLLNKSVEDPHPRVRLEAIVACSNIASAESMVIASRAVSQPMDRFTNHALALTVFALAPKWKPALEQGSLTFEHPEHLIFVLKTYGGADVLAQVRNLIRSDTGSPDARRMLFQLLARDGTPQDMQWVFDTALADVVLLESLPEIVELHRRKPSGDIAGALETSLSGDSKSTRAAAARLTGLWKQQQLLPNLRAILTNAKTNPEVVASAILSVSDLAPKDAASEAAPFMSAQQPPAVYLAAIEATAQHNLAVAASGGLKLISELEGSDSVAPIMNAIMNRRGASAALAQAIPDAELSADNAKLISRWMSASGHDDADLILALKKTMGITASGSPTYNPQFVRDLAAEVRQSGDGAAGRRVFLSSLANCSSCHAIKGLNQPKDAFPKGPDLSKVGAGLQLELIIESVVWPKRQIKEGYETTLILTEDGRSLSGYLAGENNGIVRLRDLATGRIHEVRSDTIEERAGKGTAMPSGFTNTLTREELRDLIRFLSDLGNESKTGRTRSD